MNLIKALVIISIFSSCSSVFHLTDWHGSSIPGHSQASFAHFNGKETGSIYLEKSDQLHLSYNNTTDKGTLEVVVCKKNASIWKKTFSGKADSGKISLTITDPGTYSVDIIGTRAKGKFDIKYKRIPSKNITIRINKNIELFGLMMQLNLREDLEANNDSLMIDGRSIAVKDRFRLTINNYIKYQKFDKSKIMDIYRSYSSKGYFNDFFIGFLLQVDEVPFAKINSRTDKDVIRSFSKSGNYNSAEIDAAKFLNDLNSFYKEVEFAKYLEENDSYYRKISGDVIKNLPPSNFLPMMEAFYQKSFNAYCLVPSLNIPAGMGFGIGNKNSLSIYNTFGPFASPSLDSSPVDLGFDYPLKIQGLSIHEFGHSFVNPAIDKVPNELIISTKHLFSPIKDAMAKQSYRSWKVCLYEHFVRAGEVILAEKLGNKLDAQKVLDDAVKRQFHCCQAANLHTEYWDVSIL
ncbi:DUF4932 domain-containing protein [Pedobacter hiemivivus]|uniref:DUF4932 domain-containing protein n=1 Tax=Pedobacter hiemivivus TaxID=2530454 RepID=A0A4V6N5X2_9SPHI|nr:DUF4932 domain-containing protein [Pedobacter hiemivivus]TCC96976.1 DUF4932 domain-containing protein [Pedobacter hiemivivus]